MSSNRLARTLAVLCGVLALLALPAAVTASRFLSGVVLLRALYVAVPVACVFGLVAVVAARRARLGVARSVRPEGVRGTRIAGLVAYAGLYVGATGGLALAVYGALRWAQ